MLQGAELCNLTQGIHSNACCKVQVLLAMCIIQPSTLSMCEDKLWPCICLHDVPAS